MAGGIPGGLSGMAIKFTCDTCGKTVSAPDQAAGKRGRCPYCQAKITIPAAGQPAGPPTTAPAPPAPAAPMPSEPPGGPPPPPVAEAPAPPPAAAVPTPPPAPAPPAEPDEEGGFGLAPTDESTDELKQRLIEQALDLDDELEDRPAAPPSPAAAPPKPESPAPAPPTAPPAAPEGPPTPPAQPAAPVEPPQPAPLGEEAIPLIDEPGESQLPPVGDVQAKFTPEEVANMAPVDCIATYLRLKVDSKLEEASRFVVKMKKPQRREIQQVVGSLDPATLTHPALAEVPPPVLKAFLTQMERELR
jgi:hypothetical protein